MARGPRLFGLAALIAIGCASSGAHIGNNFTTYLIGGLVDRYGFSPVQMGAFAMTETLAYAIALFLAAPRVAKLSARTIAIMASSMVVAGQGICLVTAFYPLLLATRLVAGFGFGLLNCAVNLAAGQTGQPTRAISAGIALQTLLFAAVNIALPRMGSRACSRRFLCCPPFWASGLCCCRPSVARPLLRPPTQRRPELTCKG
jgi:MFS family permease